MMISHLKLHWLLYWCVTHAFAALCVVSVVFPESYFFFFGRVVQYGSVFISLICWGGSPLYISQIRPLTSIKIDTWRIHSHEGVSNHYTVFAFFLNYLFQFPKWIFSGFDKYATQRKTFWMECTQIQCKDVEYRGSRITWTKYNNCENLRMWSYWNYLTYFNILTF